MTSNPQHLNLLRAMIGPSRQVSALVVIAVLVLLGGICAGEQMHFIPHLEVSEACCAFSCSVLPMAFSAFALWAAVASLRPATTPPVRSTVKDPLSPPPELIAFRSA